MIFGGFEFCGVFGGLDLFGGLVVWWFAEFLVCRYWCSTYSWLGSLDLDVVVYD